MKIVLSPGIPEINTPAFLDWLHAYHTARNGHEKYQLLKPEVVKEIMKRHDIQPDPPIPQPVTHKPQKSKGNKIHNNNRTIVRKSGIVRKPDPPSNVCPTCHERPGVEYGYCNECWQMWLEKSR